MGLFSGKKSANKKKTPNRRNTRSDAELNEMRTRARQRLIGALALVLLAFLIIPLMFDEDPIEEHAEGPVVLPSEAPRAPDGNFPAKHEDPEFSSEQTALADQEFARSETDGSSGQVTRVDSPLNSSTATAEGELDATPAEPEDEAVTDHSEAEAPTAPDAIAEAEDEPARSDDGSVALALLEGRSPPSDTQASSGDASDSEGAFILQIAAYSKESDAKARQQRLAEAGVTNAYVEASDATGSTTYRLRVGTFSSRDAAQAAQARLRTLGYDNSLLLTQ